MRRVFPALLCLAGLLASGCAPVDVEGEWNGDWHATPNIASGTLSLTLVQDGDQVSGHFDLGGTFCVGSGSVDGTVDKRTFEATLSNDVGGEIHLHGTIGDNDDRIQGGFDVTAGFCQNASGSFDVSHD